jgi:ribosomal protein S27E
MTCWRKTLTSRINFTIIPMDNNEWNIVCADNFFSSRGKSLSCDDIDSIYHIAQDWWAHSLWEYLKCEDCNQIYWKKEIYSKLPDFIVWRWTRIALKKQLVSDIEKILSATPEIDFVERSSHWYIKCLDCSGRTHLVFSQDYKEEIRERYKTEDTYVTLYRDSNWSIKGFSDWSITTVRDFYKRELEHYYSHVWLDSIQTKVDDVLGLGVSSSFIFACNAIGVYPWYNNIFTYLLYYFYSYVSQEVWRIDGIYESSLGTKPHDIYIKSWAQPLSIGHHAENNNTSQSIRSDVFVHKDITETSMRFLSEVCDF